MAPRFAAALSEHPDPAVAVAEAVGQVGDVIGVGANVMALFVSDTHLGALDDIAEVVHRALDPRVLVGMGGESVLGPGREVELGPGLALWAGRLDGALPVRVEPPSLLDVEASAERIARVVDPSRQALVLLTDPFSFPADTFLAALGAACPTLDVVGGLASAARRPGGNRLVLGRDVHRDGAVGVLVPRHAVRRVVVSQGCRPIGEPLVVTRAHGNVIDELAGRPPLERLQELFELAPPEERALMERGLHVGLVIDERKERFGRGDFLIRGVVGIDQSTGAVAVGDRMQVGATVQFQVRDAHSAHDDLAGLLAGVAGDAALVFTCNGRGASLFGRPHHDAELVGDVAGDAVAGVFCAGELGPIGGRNFLHGYTASVLVLGGADPTDEPRPDRR